MFVFKKQYISAEMCFMLERRLSYNRNLVISNFKNCNFQLGRMSGHINCSTALVRNGMIKIFSEQAVQHQLQSLWSL